MHVCWEVLMTQKPSLLSFMRWTLVRVDKVHLIEMYSVNLVRTISFRKERILFYIPIVIIYKSKFVNRIRKYLKMI